MVDDGVIERIVDRLIMYRQFIDAMDLHRALEDAHPVDEKGPDSEFNEAMTIAGSILRIKGYVLGEGGDQYERWGGSAQGEWFEEVMKAKCPSGEELLYRSSIVGGIVVRQGFERGREVVDMRGELPFNPDKDDDDYQVAKEDAGRYGATELTEQSIELAHSVPCYAGLEKDTDFPF